MAWYYGNCVWYDDCNGSNGRCGDCDDDEDHVAWPYYNDGGGCSGSSCDCDCGNNPEHDCDYWILVKNWCNQDQVWGQIKDCSTASPHGCSHNPQCSPGSPWTGWDIPTVEVTSTMFENLGADLDLGRIPASVWA